MKLISAVGSSRKADGFEAGIEAASVVRDKLGSVRPDFIFVFCTIGFELEDVLAAVKDTLGDVPLSGATFEGIIGLGLADESMYAVQVTGMQSDSVQFHNFIGLGSVETPVDAGVSLGRNIAQCRSPGNRVLFLFPDFRTNTTCLFEGIEQHCSVPFIGGAAADNLKFKQSYQFHNGEVFDHCCAGVLMTGEFDTRSIVTHGSEPLGNPRVVTRAEGNVIYEIDDRSALEVASEALGEPISAGTIGAAITLLGIGLHTDNSAGFLSPYVLRAIHGFDFEENSLMVPVVVPEGETIQFMRRDPQSVLDSGKAAALKLSSELKLLAADPILVCQFDCAGRGKSVIGEQVQAGIDDMQNVFQSRPSWMGAFSFGEISPVAQHNHFHNFTATLTVFY